MISLQVLVIRNFFVHPRFEDIGKEESNNKLEYEDQELQIAYKEFFLDVVYEIEKYGPVTSLITSKQTTPHFRGTVLVEFKSKRDALKAQRGLIGRFYDGRQLNVEFSGISSFAIALCGTFVAWIT